MKIRTMIGLISSIGFFLFTIYLNYGLVINKDEIWWFAIITQSVYAGLCYGIFRICTMKTFREQYEERYGKTFVTEGSS